MTIHKNTAQNGQPAVCGGRRPGDAISRGVHFYYKAFSLPVHNAARPRLTKELEAQFAERARLEKEIKANLERLVYGK
jgi:hypothetical protein